MSSSDVSYFDYFSGYVPSGEIFRMAVDDIVELTTSDSGSAFSPTNSLCMIGLVSYFEAFAKDHFSSVISIGPSLIPKLREGGFPTDIPGEEAYEFRETLKYEIGFLIGQRLDFGSAKKINALFTQTIKITPFSKDDAKRYDTLLRDRNLIVHHGGIYTTAYIKQAFDEIDPQRRRAHADSIVVSTEKVKEMAEFLKRVAHATIKSSAAALTAMATADPASTTGEIAKAIHAMEWWDDES